MQSRYASAPCGEHQSCLENELRRHFVRISVLVSDCLSAVKPSKPRCWMEGKLLEGGDVKMSCKSADGSDPLHYKWERVMDKGKYGGKLPSMALVGKSAHTSAGSI